MSPNRVNEPMPIPLRMLSIIILAGLMLFVVCVLVLLALAVRMAYGKGTLQKDKTVLIERIPHSKDVDAQLRQKLEEMGWRLFNEGCRKVTDSVVLRGEEVFITLVCEERR